jgi:hypothetical protein
MLRALWFPIAKSTERMNCFERFLSPTERMVATHELAALGNRAIPILESLFDGSAKNASGSSYCKIGALGCGYITVGILGPLANELESYVREGIQQDDPYAIEAAGALSEIELETAFALAQALIRNPASEASASLIRRGYSEDITVLRIISGNTVAIKSFEKTKAYMSKRP